MKEINLDARAWRNRDDFYDAFLPSLGAPHWHGRNLDALNDSLRCDDINAVRLPLHIRITNSTSVPAELRRHLQQLAELIADLRTRDGREIQLTLG